MCTLRVPLCQVSASNRRKKRKMAGEVDLMAELPVHDLTLDGVTRNNSKVVPIGCFFFNFE